MSDDQHRRISSTAGWHEGKRPLGANGRPLCRWCRKECPRGRRTFCSDGCVHKHKLTTQPRYVAQCVERRDHGVCAECGRDCVALMAELWGLTLAAREVRARELRIPLVRLNGHRLWDADHVVPIEKGGGACDLSNYRTLCVPCHNAKTAAHATARAAARAATKGGAA
jgi:5-methylcytosine-specific restriction protein A